MNLTPEQIGHITHAANAALSLTADGEHKLPWYCEDPDFRQNVSEVIEEVINDPSITPEQLHNKWMGNKLQNGWVYGDIISDEDKTHPCLIDYDKLDDTDKFKDRLFLAIVRVCTE